MTFLISRGYGLETATRELKPTCNASHNPSPLYYKLCHLDIANEMINGGFDTLHDCAYCFTTRPLAASATKGMYSLIWVSADSSRPIFL